jgi:dienelactone hydrolase
MRTLVFHHAPPASTTRLRSLAAAVTESRLARAALAVIALHVVDDSFLQPNAGVTATDHLIGGLALVTLLGLGAAIYPHLRAGARGAASLLAGFLGLLVGTEAAYYAAEVGPSGDDYSGLLAVIAGLVLLGIGTATLWRSRRRDDRLWWRYGRRGLIAAAAFIVANVVLLPLAVAYVVTHAAAATVPAARLGAAYERVEFTTSDGLRLSGWYVPSRNGAAVIAVPGRTTPQPHARMLVRHGYGVLLFDRRGEGQSDGDPNVFGWDGTRDIDAAVTYLQGRPDVDPWRIGGIGFSVGGEMLIEAAARSTSLRAIVSEGASGRSIRDDLANPDTSWQEMLGDAVTTAGVTVLTGELPPPDLQHMVPRISASTFFIYGENGQPSERPANRAFATTAAPGDARLWEVPHAGHTGGIDAAPQEYERRVIAFFDNMLLGR